MNDPKIESLKKLRAWGLVDEDDSGEPTNPRYVDGTPFNPSNADESKLATYDECVPHLGEKSPELRTFTTTLAFIQLPPSFFFWALPTAAIDSKPLLDRFDTHVLDICALDKDKRDWPIALLFELVPGESLPKPVKLLVPGSDGVLVNPRRRLAVNFSLEDDENEGRLLRPVRTITLAENDALVAFAKTLSIEARPKAKPSAETAQTAEDGDNAITVDWKIPKGVREWICRECPPRTLVRRIPECDDYIILDPTGDIFPITGRYAGQRVRIYTFFKGEFVVRLVDNHRVRRNFHPRQLLVNARKSKRYVKYNEEE